MRLKKSRKFLIFLTLFLSAPAYTSADNKDVSAHDTPASAGTLDFANGLYARKMYGPAVSEYDKFIKANPASPDIASARFRLADSFYFMKDYVNASSHFESFIRDFPEDKRTVLAAFRLGTAKFNMNDFAASSGFFLKVSLYADDPSLRSGALFYLSKTYQAMKNIPSAIAIMKRLIENYPQTEYAAYAGLMLGDIYRDKKEFSQAIESYQVSSDRKTPVLVAEEASLKIADIYFSQKDYATARDYYQKIYETEKKQPSKNTAAFFDKSLTGLFYCDYHKRDIESAKKLLADNQEALDKSASRFEIFYILANLGAETKQFDFALACLDRIEKDPGAGGEFIEKVLFKRASVLQAMGKTKEAASELQKITNPDSKNAARAYFERAEILREGKNYEEAAAAYEAVLKTPDNSYSKPALYSMAVSHSLAGKKKQAKEEFFAYLEKYPNDEDSEKALLQAVQADMDMENFTEALKNSKKFFQSYPKSKFMDIAYYKTGMIMTGLKKFKEASGFFRKVISEYNGSQLMAESVYGAAVSLENAGEISEAASFYEKLLKDHPDHPLSKDASPRLGYLYIQETLYDKAVVLYQDILLNKPDVVVQPKTVFWLIRYLMDRSRYEEMKQVLEILPKRFSENDLSHETNFFLGESQMGLKDYVKASEFYKKSIEARADGEFTPHAYLGLGIAAVAQEDFASAEKSFAEAIKYDTEVDVTLRARFEIASLKLRAGNLLDAANAFMLVAVLYDDEKYCPLALYKANECFVKLDKTEDAQKAAEELKTRYPKSEWAKKI